MKFILSAILLFALAAPVQAADFSNWAAIVATGDDHAHSGAESEVFDNARRDIGSALATIGFSPGNIDEFSVRPENYPRERLQASDAGNIADGLWDISKRARSGCFAYFTSHGSPDGIVMGRGMLSPDAMARLIGNACGSEPTIVIVSACFSGVFVPALAAPNRMIFTAARPDRTSFGCGESDHYTFFDTCFLQSLPGAGDFPGLAQRVKTCVAAREQKEGVDAPSEPQLFIGDQVADKLRWR